MRTIAPSLTILAGMLLPALLAAPAQATPVKVWIAGTGSDSNGCTVTAPCATLQHAFGAVAAGGEISVASPGEFGPVIITRTVNISNDGGGEALIQSNQTAIALQTTPGDVLTLRGLVLDGMAIGSVGVRLGGPLGALHMQNCVIKNFEGTNPSGNWGISYAPSFASQLFISNTLIYNNGSTANSGGILIGNQSAAGVNVVLDRVHLENNVIGLKVDNQLASGTTGTTVVVRDSTLSSNAGDGINISVPAARPGALVLVERSSVLGNGGTGILSSGVHAIALVSDSTVARNGSGVSAVGGGQLITYGDNRNNNNVGAEGTATASFTLF